MARLIEIKGLGADIASVKAGIGELRAAAAELNTEKSGLTAEIKDLTEQLKQHRSDLRFEAETLGNSSGNTDEKKVEPPAPLNSDSAGAGSGR
jgi:predicted  nucleic acid-binding Zn-ribbon protein